MSKDDRATIEILARDGTLAEVCKAVGMTDHAGEYRDDWAKTEQWVRGVLARHGEPGIISLRGFQQAARGILTRLAGFPAR